MCGGFLLCRWVIGGVSGSLLGLLPLLGDDLEDFDHLGFTFLGDVVERMVDGVGELLYELVRGVLIESHGFHGGAAVTQVEYFLAGALEVEEPGCGCHGIILEDLVG